MVTAETMNPTTPRPYGDTFFPSKLSITQPSAAITTAAKRAWKNVIVLKPGIKKPTSIKTKAETIKRTTAPIQSRLTTPLLIVCEETLDLLLVFRF